MKNTKKQRNVSPSEQEEDERGPMPTSAIKNLLKKWKALRAMVLEWHPNQADLSRSDESRFQLNRTDGLLRVWREPLEPMDPTCQHQTVQAGGGSMMVRGVCSWRDMGPLICLDTSLTGDRYASILSDHLQPFMSIVHSEGLGEFQKDNATPLTSRIATY
ncbi:transposable element Tcb2 transposase [Trichonephila clavipes]|nr:transposable element Tcb2 transposase [Trichonephila clavipes]